MANQSRQHTSYFKFKNFNYHLNTVIACIPQAIVVFRCFVR